MKYLLLKAVTDRNAKQLREERGVYNGIDSLTSDELEQYRIWVHGHSHDWIEYELSGNQSYGIQK